jgi:hypothetical protein
MERSTPLPLQHLLRIRDRLRRLPLDVRPDDERIEKREASHAARSEYVTGKKAGSRVRICATRERDCRPSEHRSFFSN